jgi:hypothetical protein
MSTPAPATDFLHARLEPLRQKIMAASNGHCFIERQEIMADVALSPAGQQDIIDRTEY